MDRIIFTRPGPFFVLRRAKQETFVTLETAVEFAKEEIILSV